MRSGSNFASNYRDASDYGIAMGGGGGGWGARVIYAAIHLTPIRHQWRTDVNTVERLGSPKRRYVNQLITVSVPWSLLVGWLESWLICCRPAFYVGCFVLGSNNCRFIVVVIISKP
jgi:hypothetical protein